MRKTTILAAAMLCVASGAWAQSATRPMAVIVTSCGTAPSSAYAIVGGIQPIVQDVNGNQCTSASVSASIAGFSPASTGTPISVTTGGVTGTLPAGAVVVASNVGATNGAYCKLGASATTSDQLIPPNSWFAFTVGAATQLTCITGTSTTTVNMVGGAGLPTGAGGGGGGGSGGSVTQGTSPWIVAGGGTAGSAATGVATIQGIASMTPVQVSQATASNLNANITNISGTVSLPTGASTAAKQPALGTAGTASTDVLTIQGIASMTKLLVTPDSVALPANQSVNISQMNGVTTTMGNGVSGTGVQRVTIASDSTGTVAATQSGTWNVTNVSGTVSLPTGASTAANQTSVIGTKAAGTAATNSQLSGLVYNSTPLTLTDGQQSSLQGDANGYLKVNVAAGGTVTQGSTTSGQGGSLVMGAVTTAAPSYTTAQTSPLSLTTAGGLRFDLTSVGGTTVVNGGVAGSQSIGGTVATNVAITDNPINNGAQAVSSENAAVTTARKVQLVADLVGKLIVLPYANPENFVSGAITSAMTGTTSTSLIAAPASGLRNYITNCVVSNAHATVGTDMILQDGNGGTTLYTIPAAAVYGGASVSFPTPLRQPTTATALYIANVTTGASTKASCSGYKGA